MRNKALGAIAVVIALVAGGFVYVRSTMPQEASPVTVIAKEDIVIGFVAAQTKNAVANFGIAARIGFEIAVDEINAKGGIMGHKIRPVVFDDEGDKDISKKQVEQLVFQEHASAIVGPANSGNALYWLDIPQDNEVTVIAPIATATEITTRYAQRPRNYIFRVSSLDKEQVRLLIAWAVKKTNNGKIAIFHDTTPYGLQGEKDVTEVLARWGKTPSSVKSFDKTDTDEKFTALLKDAEKSGADAIMVYSLVDSSSRFAKAAGAIEGYKPILLGTAANSIDLPTLIGPAATHIYWSAVILDERDPLAVALNERVKPRNGGKISPAITTTANAYDAVYLIKAAFEKAGSIDKRAMRDALEDTTNVNGVWRTYVKPFSKDDHEGSGPTDFVVGRWIDGSRTYLNDETRDIEVR